MACEAITLAMLFELFLSSPPWEAFLCPKIFDVGFGTRRRYLLTAGGFGATLASILLGRGFVTGFPPSSSTPYPLHTHFISPVFF
ncbi:hypothetical protein QBC45DRAFT_407135 [Copromyces sp. CBS 386.78]|nr:hypothetical protein QBC45DRAFT_407135 [Copromyces sp. CBS 386.78]